MDRIEKKVAAFGDDRRRHAQDRRSAGGEPVVTDRNRVVGKDVDALDRRLVEVDRHEKLVRGKQAPVEIEMDPHL